MKKLVASIVLLCITFPFCFSATGERENISLFISDKSLTIWADYQNNVWIFKRRVKPAFFIDKI